MLPGDNPSPAAIWGSGSSDIFVAGGDRVWHYDGTGWTEETLSTPAEGLALWGSGPDNVLLVGQSGMAFHYDGASWSDIHAEHSWAFQAVWGDESDVRAVGSSAVISRRPLR